MSGMGIGGTYHDDLGKPCCPFIVRALVVHDKVARGHDNEHRDQRCGDDQDNVDHLESGIRELRCWRIAVVSGARCREVKR